MAVAKLKKIVFVCTGNTCRSPIAEYLLRQALKKKKLRGFKVVSAGVSAKKGDTMNPKSVQVLTENGIETGKFLSAPITEKLLKEAFVFICMTQRAGCWSTASIIPPSGPVWRASGPWPKTPPTPK